MTGGTIVGIPPEDIGGVLQGIGTTGLHHAEVEVLIDSETEMQEDTIIIGGVGTVVQTVPRAIITGEDTPLLLVEIDPQTMEEDIVGEPAVVVDLEVLLITVEAASFVAHLPVEAVIPIETGMTTALETLIAIGGTEGLDFVPMIGAMRGGIMRCLDYLLGNTHYYYSLSIL